MQAPCIWCGKVVEHEVAAIDALRMLGYLTADADEYGLVEGLRVTKVKARSLLYHSALRQMDDEPEVDELLRVAISAVSSVGGKIIGKVTDEAVNALWPFLSGKIEQLRT